MCKKGGFRNKCGCSNGFILDVYERSSSNGLTVLDRTEWLERLNEIINNGSVSISDGSSSEIGTGVIGEMIIG